MVPPGANESSVHADECVVFQYTFKIPGEDKEWILMWDYNIGLVRTTHLFKCSGYSKVNICGFPRVELNTNQIIDHSRKSVDCQRWASYYLP